MERLIINVIVFYNVQIDGLVQESSAVTPLIKHSSYCSLALTHRIDCHCFYSSDIRLRVAFYQTSLLDRLYQLESKLVLLVTS